MENGLCMVKRKTQALVLMLVVLIGYNELLHQRESELEIQVDSVTHHGNGKVLPPWLGQTSLGAYPKTWMVLSSFMVHMWFVSFVQMNCM